MMQKLEIRQEQRGKLTAQQVQLVRMLQLPAEAMVRYVQEELLSNPTLEEQEISPEESIPMQRSSGGMRSKKTVYLSDEMLKSSLGVEKVSWHEQLIEQLALLPLTPKEKEIATYLVGSLAPDGYLRTHLEVLVRTLSFTYYIETTSEEITRILHQLQTLDPPGIAARTLQECLALQLRRKPTTPVVAAALQIVEDAFEAFSKKNYEKVRMQTGLEEQALFKEAIELITHLAPKPITSGFQEVQPPLPKPDFRVEKEEDGGLTVRLYHDFIPNVRIRKEYRHMLQRHQKKKGATSQKILAFVKEKVQRAQWFIESIEKRRTTLLRTMKAIVKRQAPFFHTEEEQNLRPLLMREIAEDIKMDISTVSRVVRDKVVTTPFGDFPLKFFFSKALTSTQGEQVSNSVIKKKLQKIIEGEDKNQPYTDDRLAEIMHQEGYPIARRTVAKYRKQLGMATARMRKEL